jgi:hypothetical protein
VTQMCVSVECKHYGVQIRISYVRLFINDRMVTQVASYTSTIRYFIVSLVPDDCKSA